MTDLAALIFAMLAAPALPAIAAGDAKLSEYRCSVVRTDPAGKSTLEDAPELHVLSQTAVEGAFKPALPAGTQAIICDRSSIVPAEHDDEVLALGLRFFIAEQGQGNRVATLEIIDGHYRFRLVEGELKPGEEPLLQARIDLFKIRRERSQ